MAISLIMLRRGDQIGYSPRMDRDPTRDLWPVTPSRQVLSRIVSCRPQPKDHDRTNQEDVIFY